MAIPSTSSLRAICRHDIAIQNDGSWRSVKACIWGANTCARLTKTSQPTPTIPQVPIKSTALPGECMLESVSSQLSFFDWKTMLSWTSLLVQWIRIRLPMQRTQVHSLVREDSTCREATKPTHHNYWAHTLRAPSHQYWPHILQVLVCMLHAARMPRACAPKREAITMRSPCTTRKSSPCSLQPEKAWAKQWRPSPTKNINK